MAKTPTVLTEEQKAKATADKNAAKAAKFLELASKRMTVALDKIALLGNLSNKSSYGYTPEQVQAMTDALNAQVTTTMGRFAVGAVETKSGFQFKVAATA